MSEQRMLEHAIGEQKDIIDRLQAANAALEAKADTLEHALSHVELSCTAWEHKAHELESRVAEFEAELERYRGGVEVEGRVIRQGSMLHVWLVMGPTFYEGQRVRVIVMKEAGDE